MGKMVKEGISCIKWNVKKVKRFEELGIGMEKQIIWYTVTESVQKGNDLKWDRNCRLR